VIRRRTFLAGLGSAAAWPMVTRAQQQGERVRRIGVLMNLRADGSDEGNWAVFLQTLQQLGWIEGRNVQIETRSSAVDAAEIRRHAAELVAAAPDVIVSTGNAGVGPLLQETRIIPIVFNNVVALKRILARHGQYQSCSAGKPPGTLFFSYPAIWPSKRRAIANRSVLLADLRWSRVHGLHHHVSDHVCCVRCPGGWVRYPPEAQGKHTGSRRKGSE
jgi:hypothetical protein